MEQRYNKLSLPIVPKRNYYKKVWLSSVLRRRAKEIRQNRKSKKRGNITEKNNQGKKLLCAHEEHHQKNSNNRHDAHNRIVHELFFIHEYPPL
jgi:hypothetical protein